MKLFCIIFIVFLAMPIGIFLTNVAVKEYKRYENVTPTAIKAKIFSASAAETKISYCHHQNYREKRFLQNYRNYKRIYKLCERAEKQSLPIDRDRGDAVITKFNGYASYFIDEKEHIASISKTWVDDQSEELLNQYKNTFKTGEKIHVYYNSLTGEHLSKRDIEIINNQNIISFTNIFIFAWNFFTYFFLLILVSNQPKKVGF